MTDHLKIEVSDFNASKAFYKAALTALGDAKLVEGEAFGVRRIGEDELFGVRAGADQDGRVRRDQRQKLFVVDDVEIARGGFDDFNGWFGRDELD